MAKGYVLNLSHAGLFAMAPKGITVGSQLRVDFDVGEVNCQAIGNVAYDSDMGAYAGLGIELTQVTPTYTEFIYKLMKASTSEIMKLVDAIVRINIVITGLA